MNILLGCLIITVLVQISVAYIVDVNGFAKKNVSESDMEGNIGDINIMSFVEKYGYPIEEHSVTTEDKYILTVHRIAYGKTNSKKENRPPILLGHCMFGTSAIFVMFGPEISLAFQLAEAGYDVWLANNRGNTYSRKHVTLDPSKNASYWDFSFHELGYYDTPAMIDYVLKQTKNEKLTYIGFSQGSTQYFVMGSTRPNYNDKINVMAALAPVAYLEHPKHPLIAVLKKLYPYLEGMLVKCNVTELFAHNNVLNILIDRICTDAKFVEICATVTMAVSGFDSDELDRSTISKIYDVLPGGGSLKEGVHYLQEIDTSFFRQYDYGIIKNMKQYGQSTPPNYNMTKLTAPVALFYSENDLFASLTDVERLAKELPKVEKHKLAYKNFTHFDYIIAKDLPSLLHYDLINTLNKVNGLPAYTTVKPTPTTQIPEHTTTGSAIVVKYSLLTTFTCFVGLLLLH